jgi:acyl-CoA synthetase (AMP-forming)/AMP-acid ligase II
VLSDEIRSAAQSFGNATVMVAPDGLLTYRTLETRSDRIASALWDAGLRPGDRIALRLASGTSYLLAYAAIAKIGGVVAGINSGLADDEQRALIALVEPALVIDSAEALGEFEARGGPRFAGVRADPKRLAALVFTSGTSGRPRSAMFTNEQVAAVMHADTGGVRADQPGTPLLVSTHFAHVGPMLKLPWYLRRGLQMHVLPRWRAADYLRFVAELRLPEIGAIPPQLALMLRTPEVAKLDLSCVRRIVAGGAASPPALVDAVRRAFGDAEYLVRYSSTESGGVGLGTSAEHPAEALRGIGRPRPRVAARILDPDGQELAAGEVGELCLATPTAMVGYWRDETSTAAAFHGSWLRTGDLAVQNADGTYVLRGRLKEMYIRGGYNVYPAEVEAELARHPALAACAVLSRPDPVMGEVGVAIVALERAAPTPSLADLRGFLDGRLARWKLPEALLVVEEMPLNSTHKPDRRVLAEMIAGGRHHQRPV